MAVRLFVGNLPYDVTESEIREFFASAGRLSRVFLPVDRETGKQRGFAFIEFGTQAEAEDAIRRLNDQSFKGRPIAVKEARERENRTPGANGSGPPRPYTPRPYSPMSRPGPRPTGMGGGGGGGGSYPARPTEEISTPQRRRSFGPPARPDRKRRPQLNRPHKSEWGKKAFKRERLRDDDEEDLSLFTTSQYDEHDSDARESAATDEYNEHDSEAPGSAATDEYDEYEEGTDTEAEHAETEEEETEDEETESR